MSSLDTAGPVLDARGRALDRIVLRGLSARGRHGVLDPERALGQRFGLDVALHLDTREAAAGDDLTATVNYGTLAQQLEQVLAGDPVDLLETLAQRVADTCLAASGRVEAVDVVVHKPQAPVPVPFDDVELVIRRTRS
ncbi:dihydroneopterin aldolase [Kineococcus rhizosphaerae]|uniref:dihydroneopterin aldolase n=1 Tax=Kineococcus rhizosphaerae TaxID=559628 RepID=UPI000D077B76|nr:dihydroneopterin aldolase [Kineococcus rhizosphaerae]